MAKSQSKFLSYVLRHDPQAAHVEMDDGGWVLISDLLRGMAEVGRPITIEQLEEIVASDNKSRYAFSQDKTMIRANQGHSVKVKLGYKAQKPPQVLYHGTATRFLESIRRQGLIAGNRHHVHLSTNIETAMQVGRRHGKPALLEIKAEQMHNDGIEFYLSDNGVWLVGSVSPGYIEFGDQA